MKINLEVKIIVIALVTLTLYCLISTGFNKTNVSLSNYSISNDGTKLTFNTYITSSIGYTRGFKDIGGKAKPHYLVFYSTFLGVNSSIGAKDKFVLELDESDLEIYFNDKNGGYKLVLEKDLETGLWVKS